MVLIRSARLAVRTKAAAILPLLLPLSGVAGTLTVTNGGGSAIRPATSVGEVLADAPAAGFAFDRWSGDTSGLADVRAPRTTFAMPSGDARLTATYRVAPSFTPISETIGAAKIVWFIPERHVGVVFRFHGAGASAAKITSSVEGIQLDRALVAAGHGFVAIDAADPTHWSALPLATNPDLQNILAVIQSLTARGAMSSSDTLFSHGLSAGTGIAWNSAAALGFAGVAEYIGASEALFPSSVPTFFALAQNDGGGVRPRQLYDDLVARGIPAKLHVNAPAPVYSNRFLRIAGIDATGSAAIAEALRAGGFLDANGYLLADPKTSGWQKTLPSAYSSYQTQIEEELEVCNALHAFFSDADDQVVAFFDARRPAVRTIPIVLDVFGRGGARFTSELVLANSGSTKATARLTYTAASALQATGSGVVDVPLEAGQQLLIPDALAYLREHGLEIPEVQPGAPPQAGTLRVVFSGLSTLDAGYAAARTTTPAGSGRAGLAYLGNAPEQTASGLVRLVGLRENAADRTNLALVNAGTGGPITLRVTLSEREAGAVRNVVLSPDRVLGPGQWLQIDSVLSLAGMTNASATVQRVSGSDPFIVYAVFNDNVTNDGSFVAPLPSFGAERLFVPVIVESPTFDSELFLLNPDAQPVTVSLNYVESLPALRAVVAVTDTLQPGEQKIIPRVFDYMRARGGALGARGAASYAGGLRISFANGATLKAGLAGVRTGAASAGGGQYGLSYPGVPPSLHAPDEAYVFGLKQDSRSRSNLAFMNAGESSLTLRYQVFDATGKEVGASQPFTLARGGWLQVNAVLTAFGIPAGYVRITKISGQGFIAYGVVNDGAAPGEGTNDGSYVEMTVKR